MQDQNPALMDENPFGSDFENDISKYLDDSLGWDIDSDGVTDDAVPEEYYDDVEAYPVGLRFAPTDAEVIYYYLKNKVENRPLPPVSIKEVDIYKFNPEDLAKMYRPNCDRPKEWYFFTPRDRKYRNGKRPNRQAGDGFWRATGADTEVKKKGEVIGWKRALVYYCGKPRKGEKTNWIMHEYMLKDAHPSSTIGTSNDMKLDVCVLCKIYKNTRKSDIEQEQRTSQNHTLYTSQNQISSSYQYGVQATNVNSFQNQPSSSYQGMQLGAQVTSAEDNFQSQPSSFHQCQQLGGQKEPCTTISYSSMMTPYDPMIAMSVNGFQNQPSSSYQGMQLGAQTTSTENNFQPSSSHQNQQLGGQQEPHTTLAYSSMMTTYDPMIATSVNGFQNQPSSSYQGMQLGAQATSTENNFQSQPSSFHQSQQLGDQQEPDTTISYSSMMTTYDPMIDNTTNYIQMEYLNPTPLQSFPSAFDPQEFYVNTEMENNVNDDVLFP